MTPQSADEAKELVNRNTLEELRDHGDYPTLAEIRLRHPGDRDEFEDILASVTPDAVVIIGYFFPELGGGTAVPVNTDGISPLPAQLIAKSKALVAARFAGASVPDLNVLAPHIESAFSLAKEKYTVIYLKATPSKLLATWGQHSNIKFIAVVTKAPVP